MGAFNEVLSCSERFSDDKRRCLSRIDAASGLDE